MRAHALSSVFILLSSNLLKVIGVSVENMPGRYTLDDVDNMKDEDFGVVKVFLRNGECRLFLYDKKRGHSIVTTACMQSGRAFPFEPIKNPTIMVIHPRRATIKTARA